MVIHDTGSLIHWNYFLALEADIERLARYVEFTKKNFDTFSIEIAHLLLSASSEVDVVVQQLCQKIDGTEKAENIEQYRNVFRKHIPSLEKENVTIPRYGLVLSPWSNWQKNESPDWWRGYNKVKHERNTYFEKASLKNVLNSMAGLLLLILHFYRGTTENNRIVPPPTLFIPPSELAFVAPAIEGEMSLYFRE